MWKKYTMKPNWGDIFKMSGSVIECQLTCSCMVLCGKDVAAWPGNFCTKLDESFHESSSLSKVKENLYIIFWNIRVTVTGHILVLIWAFLMVYCYIKATNRTKHLTIYCPPELSCEDSQQFLLLSKAYLHHTSCEGTWDLASHFQQW